MKEPIAIQSVMKRKNDQPLIDPRADIHPTAEIAEGVKIGPWTVIGPNVQIDTGTEIGSHVVIERYTRLGKNNKISPFAVLGGDPQDTKYKGDATFLEIGDDNLIREYVTINRGSAGGSGITKIGNKNSFLAYAHVAHDCKIGNEVWFVNHGTVAGHVTVDDYAIIGAFCAVHQFSRVGAYAFLSHSAMVTQDILPYMLVIGPENSPCGLNTIGLKRRGFSAGQIRNIKEAYRLIYRRGYKLKEIREQLALMAKEFSEIDLMLEFLDQSKRGIAR